MVDDAQIILNWLSRPSPTIYNTGETMKVYIPKKIVTNVFKVILATTHLEVKRNAMLFPTQITAANNIFELQQYIEDLILSAVDKEYAAFKSSHSPKVVLELKWQLNGREGTQYEKYYNLVAGPTEETVARIIIIQPETSFTNLKKGLDAWFEMDIVDSEATE